MSHYTETRSVALPSYPQFGYIPSGIGTGTGTVKFELEPTRTLVCTGFVHFTTSRTPMVAPYLYCIVWYE